jgi:general nucleoside transport system permease protein
VSVRRVALGFLAPVAALAFALLVSSLALILIDQAPLDAFKAMLEYGLYDAEDGLQTDSLISMANRAAPLYLSGLAVAIGFKMNLFNIGVEGQYRLAALIAASVGGAVALPAPLHVTLIIVTAMAVGAFWAGIAGVLKVTRGVHEVISTIMLNFIATGLGAYLLATYLSAERGAQDLIIGTPEIPPSGRFPSLNRLLTALGVEEVPADLFGFTLIAVLVGAVFYVLVWRTRFGYDLRASGVNPGASRASGVDPGGMVIRTMLLSGAIAGLVGLTDILGFSYSFNLDFPAGLGFAGIAVALVGRNHPVGIGLAAILFAFIDRSAQILDLEDVPKEIIQIMQGVIILSVVIAYEVVRRLVEAQEVKAAAAATRPRERPPGAGNQGATEVTPA